MCVIPRIKFYLVMYMYGPSTLDGNISAGHKPMSSEQVECDGPLIVQYAICINTHIYIYIYIYIVIASSTLRGTLVLFPLNFNKY